MNPAPTGSLETAMTTGIVAVTCLTAAITGFDNPIEPRASVTCPLK